MAYGANLLDCVVGHGSSSFAAIGKGSHQDIVWSPCSIVIQKVSAIPCIWSAGLTPQDGPCIFCKQWQSRRSKLEHGSVTKMISECESKPRSIVTKPLFRSASESLP